jgi:hypothetical protein
MTRFLSIAHQVGELVERKNAAYGSSFAKAGAALRLLYPEGIPLAQMDDALLIARIWDKLQRIATDRDALGESPYLDIAGYGILGAALNDKETEFASGQKLQAAMPAVGMQESSDGQRPLLQPELPDGGLQGKTRNRPGHLLVPKVRARK